MRPLRDPAVALLIGAGGLLALLCALAILKGHLLLLDYVPPSGTFSIEAASLAHGYVNPLWIVYWGVSLVLRFDLAMIAITLAAFVASVIALRKRPHFQLALLLLWVNPFVYARVMVGQFNIVWALVALAIDLLLLQRYLDSGEPRDLAYVVLGAGVIALFSLHLLAICAIASAVLLIVSRGGRALAAVRRDPKPVLALAALGVALLAFTYPLLSGGTTLASIGQEDALFFTPKLTQGVPTVAKVMGMWGFWREGAYLTTYTTLPLLLWYALAGVIVGTFLIGYYVSQSPLAKASFALWWIGVILAIGISHPVTAPLFRVLFTHVPLFSGLRDSHKFVALIAIAYAFLCPVGVMWLAQQAKARLKRLGAGSRAQRASYAAVPALFVVCVLLFTYPLLGLWGQVRPTEYPRAYTETDAYLRAQDLTGHIVYLPYYDYLTYNWTLGANPDGRIANPINKLVAPTVLTNPGPWGRQTATTRAIGGCVEQESAPCLEALDVQYVLVDRCFRESASLPMTWLSTPVHEDGCVTIHELRPAHAVEREARIPLGALAGALISIAALAALIVWAARGPRRRA